jgi:hypothetical protein
VTPEKTQLLAHLKQMANGEKLFRPSSMSRLFACRGSLIASVRAGLKTESSPYAREGTAAHLLASTCLIEGKSPALFEATCLDLGDGGIKIPVTEEMADSVQMYLDEIASRWTDHTEMYVEQRMSLSVLDPDNPLFQENAGTADCVLVDRVARTLRILDLKYGKGIMVKGDTMQLKDYAVLAALAFPCSEGWALIETVIVQPRAAVEHERVKPVQYDSDQFVLSFIGELVQTMDSALDVDAPLTPGDHCKNTFCPAVATCPAVRDAAVNIARDEFAAAPINRAGADVAPLPKYILLGTNENPRPKPPEHGVTLPAPSALSEHDIATILMREPIWEAWITAVKQRAVKILESGGNVPGYKLVARAGNRAWVDPDKACEVLVSQGGLTWEAAHTTPKLLSPAQIEKKLHPRQRGLLNDIVYRPQGAPTLVRIADQREALPSLTGPLD